MLFNHNNSLLSWLLYEKYFKYPKEEYSFNELNQLHEIALSITTITTQDGKGSYNSTVIQMLKLHKKHGNNSSLKILSLLQKLDTQKLSSTAGIYEQNGREKEYQSQKEMFYAMKIKVLQELKKYDECIFCCEEALLCVEDFHHDNRVWIISRKSVSMARCGNIDEAIVELKETLMSKKHWSLYEKIAEICLMKNDSTNALLYFSIAAITNDPPNTQKLFKKLSVHNFDDKVHLQQLKNYWISIIYGKLGMHSGSIYKINASGKTGFILFDKKSYFFKAASFVQKPYFKVQDKVKFALVESFDSKKRCKSVECNFLKFDK